MNIKTQNNKTKNIKLITFLVILGIVITLFGIGCGLDFQIAKGLFINNSLINGSKITSSVLSCFLLFVVYSINFSFIINLLRQRNTNKKGLTVCGLIWGFIFMVFVIVLQYASVCVEFLYAYNNRPLAWIMYILFTILTIVCSLCFAYFYLSKHTSSKYALCACFMFMLVGAAMFGIEEIMKVVWSRPRPIAVFIFNQPYHAIWQPKPFAYKIDHHITGIDTMLLKDLFKSFPSGHTAIALLCFMGINTLISLNEYKQNKNNLAWLYIVIACFLLMGLLRMLGSCHYLTDVSFSMILGVLLAFVLPKMNWVKEKDINVARI